MKLGSDVYIHIWNLNPSWHPNPTKFNPAVQVTLIITSQEQVVSALTAIKCSPLVDIFLISRHFLEVDYSLTLKISPGYRAEKRRRCQALFSHFSHFFLPFLTFFLPFLSLFSAFSYFFLTFFTFVTYCDTVSQGTLRPTFPHS